MTSSPRATLWDFAGYLPAPPFLIPRPRPPTNCSWEGLLVNHFHMIWHLGSSLWDLHLRHPKMEPRVCREGGGEREPISNRGQGRRCGRKWEKGLTWKLKRGLMGNVKTHFVPPSRSHMSSNNERENSRYGGMHTRCVTFPLFGKEVCL